LTWSAATIEQRRFDGLRLLRQVPAITELAQLDPTGKERLRVSRLVVDPGESHADYSHDPKFTEAVAKRVYYGPVYFLRESAPYMTLSVAGTRLDAGISVAMVSAPPLMSIESYAVRSRAISRCSFRRNLRWSSTSRPPRRLDLRCRNQFC
jgi:two-component system, NtrC family, sensor kinase